MNPERWERVKEIYLSAQKAGPERRQAFLESACRGDEQLASEVASLLAQDDGKSDFFEAPALKVVAEALAEEQTHNPGQTLAGHTLLHYRVEEKIGEGGMGVVYRALDTTLGRTVALKVLPPAFASDQDRLRRFVREAKSASALSHPNVATIYEVGETDGFHFIAMEHISGQTLSQWAGNRSVAIQQIVDVGIQMADALEEAHEKGVIHRDFKPANVMVTARGQVKVLDFGLAKITRPMEGVDSSTISVTDSGLVMGTVAYMSPEQVLGRELDSRTDIFSLGVVLYELVTGRAAFEGGTTTEIMDRILHAEPDAIARFNRGVPLELERIITKCLEKDPGQRYRHASEVCSDLKRLKRDSGQGNVAAVPSRPKPHGMLWVLLWVSGVLLLAVAAAAVVWFLRQEASAPSTSMQTIPFTTYMGLVGRPDVSPDGQYVAFHWDGDVPGGPQNIYIKQVGTETPRLLTRGLVPAWSRDGLYIAFVRASQERNRGIWSIPANGGSVRLMGEFKRASGISWHPGGKWLAVAAKNSESDPFAIFLLSSENGEKRKLTSPPAGIAGDGPPRFSPDGRHIAFGRGTQGLGEIFILPLSADLLPEGEPTQLTSGDRTVGVPAWTADGKDIVFQYGSKTLYCGLSRMSVSASKRDPEPLSFSGMFAAADPSISLLNNRLVYTAISWDINFWRYAIPRSGQQSAPPVRFVGSTQPKDTPQYSPDGTKVAYVSYDSGNGEIWVSGSDGSERLQITHVEGPLPDYPRWSPDGKQIVFSMASHRVPQVFVVSAQGGGKPKQMTDTPFAKRNPSFSRDGRWVYFVWERPGDPQIWRMPISGGEAIQVTTNGGSIPLESLNGQALFYVKGDSLWMLPAGDRQEVKVANSVVLQNFEPQRDGVYYLSGTEADAKLARYDLSTRESEILTSVVGEVGWGFTVSTADSSFLVNICSQRRSNLMLVPNFR